MSLAVYQLAENQSDFLLLTDITSGINTLRVALVADFYIEYEQGVLENHDELCHGVA